MHVLELRAALAEVYAARGRPAPTYTRATLAPGQMAMVVDVSELRAAVRALQPA